MHRGYHAGIGGIYHLRKDGYRHRAGRAMTSKTEHRDHAAARRGSQGALDAENANFWDELCGSSLARQLGVTDASAESLARFDAAYLGHYPYLTSYLPNERLRGARVLEIGLGYGTLSGQLLSRGAQLEGVDIADGPSRNGSAPHCSSRAQEPSGRVRPGLRPRPASPERQLRLRLLDRLPAPHRQPPALRRRGAPRPQARRHGGRDALQPLLGASAKARRASGLASPRTVGGGGARDVRLECRR